MKSVHVISRLSIMFLHEERDGSYEAIRLSDDDVDRLLIDLERTKQYRPARSVCLRIVGPDESSIGNLTILQKYV